MTKFPIIHKDQFGFTVIETLIALSVLSSSYLAIFSTQHWLSASALRQERNLKEMLLNSDQHEIMLAHLFHDAE